MVPIPTRTNEYESNIRIYEYRIPNPAALIARFQEQVMVVTNWNKEQSMLVNLQGVFLNEQESITRMLSRVLRIVTW